MPVLRHIYDSVTGTYVDVEVGLEVYDCYRRMGWGIKYNDSRFYEHEIQFTSLVGNAFENFREFLADELDPEHILCHGIPDQALFDALTQLTAAECYLLQVRRAVQGRGADQPTQDHKQRQESLSVQGNGGLAGQRAPKAPL